MHLNKSTWGSGEKHGANNANVKRYIDFAAKYGFDGVLVEGWNKGWDGDWIANGDKFSFTESYPDFDLPRLSAYAREPRACRLIGHHETGGARGELRAPARGGACSCTRPIGVSRGQDRLRPPSGPRSTLDDGRRTRVVRRPVPGAPPSATSAQVAAKNHIAIDAHEPVKDTGLRRTWPNC